MSKQPIKEIGRKRILLDKLEPIPHNRVYGSGMQAKSIKELADSIAAVGIQQDLVVREHPDPAKAKRGLYQIIIGCRRQLGGQKAAEKTGIKDAPCKVVVADDQTAYELRAIENLQREDLHELEEAMELQNLLNLRDESDQPVHTWDSLAKKIGMSAAYVRARVKLLDMPELAKEAFLCNKMSSSIALLICRIPDPKQAFKATVEVLDRVAGREAFALSEDHEPMSYRMAMQHIQNHYMRRLKGSVFNQEDETLVPEFDREGQDLITGSDPKARCGGGKCSSCPCRTANMKALYPDLKSEDVCTNTPCYQLKVKAHEKREAARFKQKGQTLLPAKQAEKVVNQDGSLTFQGREKFLPLNAKLGEGRKAKTVGEVLEKAGVEHDVIVAKTPANEGARPKTVPLVPLEDKVIEALQKSGVEIQKPDRAKTNEERQTEETNRQQRQDFLSAVAATALQQLGKQIRLQKHAADIRAAVGAVLLSGHEKTWTPKMVKKLDDLELFALLFESQCVTRPFGWHATEFHKEFVELCNGFGVDVKAIQQEAETAQEKLTGKEK